VVIGDQEADHHPVAEADHRPGAVEGKGVAREAAADHHPGAAAAAEEKTAVVVRGTERDTEAVLLADRCPRERPVVAEAAAGEEIAAAPNRAENAVEDLPAAVAADHDRLPGVLVGKEDRDRDRDYHLHRRVRK